MWNIEEASLERIIETRAKSVVTNVMKAMDAGYDAKALKALVKDYIYSGFRDVPADVRSFNEGLKVSFTNKRTLYSSKE